MGVTGRWSPPRAGCRAPSPRPSAWRQPIPTCSCRASSPTPTTPPPTSCAPVPSCWKRWRRQGRSSTASWPRWAPPGRSWGWAGPYAAPVPRRSWRGWSWRGRRSTPSRAGPPAWASRGGWTASRACSTRPSWAVTRRWPCPGPRPWRRPASWPGGVSRWGPPAGSTWPGPGRWPGSSVPGITSPPWPAIAWSATSPPICSTTCADGLVAGPMQMGQPAPMMTQDGELGDGAVQIGGTVAPGFEGVRAAFARNFAEHGEVGAAFSLVHDGRMVVDLWGGVADAATGVPYTDDTLQLVFSTTKGATAICANLLAQRGELDVEAPVAEYWPEFGQAGKGEVPVRWLLGHRAGLPYVNGSIELAECLAWDPAVEALAAMEPLWEPGTAHGYHAVTYGWLVGEVVRRISGRSLGRFFADEVAGPLGLEFWIGLPAEQQPRVAPLTNHGLGPAEEGEDNEGLSDLVTQIEQL